MFTPVSRFGLAALAAAALWGLTACGDSPGSATVTTVNIRPSSYEVKPPATVAPTVPAVPEPDADGRSAAEQTYTVHQDEYPFEIAPLFDVSLDELRNYNGWEADYSNYPAPGGTVRIPPNAKFLDPTATTTTVRRAPPTRRDRRLDADLGRRPLQPDVHDRGGRRALRRHRQVRHHDRGAQRRQREHTGLAELLHRSRDQAAAAGRLRGRHGRDDDHGRAGLNLAAGRQPRSGQRRVGGRRHPAMPWRRRVVRSHCRRQPV